MAMNQAAFGQILGCTGNTISRYELGQLRPSRSVLLLLLQLTQVDAERRVFMDALDVTGEELGRWNTADLQESLEVFQSYLESAKLAKHRKQVPARDQRTEFVHEVTAILESGSPIDRQLVDILRIWRSNRGDARIGELFQDLIVYLDVRLAAKAVPPLGRGEG